MVIPLFHSNVNEALKGLARGAFASTAERDQMLQAVLAAQGLRPAQVVWMLFRPDRAIRDVGFKVLSANPIPEILEVFMAEAAGKPEAALRAATASLFALELPGLEARLAQFAHAPDPKLQETLRALLLAAPPTKGLEPLLWRLAGESTGSHKLVLLHRLQVVGLTATSIGRWQQLAYDPDDEVRELALTVIAQGAPEASVDLIVAQLPRVGYGTQQTLIAALSKLASARGPEFAERLLPLVASSNSGTRSAVLKILLASSDRAELVKRYLAFARTLAGWARDRALDSMREFGPELVEPALELLADPDSDVRGAALTVLGAFEDPRIVVAVSPMLRDPDWWLRIAAADVLARLGDPRGVPPLIEALKDPDGRWAAVEALGRIADARALPALAQLLSDPSPEVRIEVLLAMRHFQHPKILEVLQRVATSDPNRFVRSRAVELADEVAQRDNAEIVDRDALRATALKAETGADEPRLHALLVGTRNQGASDFHLAVGRPPMVRLAADLLVAKGEPFTAEVTEQLLREILNGEQWERLERDHQLDLCYYVPGSGRYRANVFLDQHGLNAVFRVIPEQPPTITEIGLPSYLAEIADYHQGLIIVCGPSGSGKSTTLAALVNLFNETRHDHIITLEDPVEFVHPFKSCLVNQREVGADTESFSRALRAALREDPDVIVIGDLRDNESVSLALTAAETGHIVLATLNSTSAHKAVDRLISSFAMDEQAQVRTALSESLKFVIAQRLLPAAEERQRVACFEILKCTMPVANLIRDEKTFQIPSLMQIGRSAGQLPLDEALRDLVRRGSITPETAYLAAVTKKDFESMVSTEFLDSQTFL